MAKEKLGTQQLSLWSKEPNSDTLQYIVDLATQVMGENPALQFSEHFVISMRQMLCNRGFVLDKNTNLNRGMKPRLMTDILVATSPPIAIEVKAGDRLLATSKYQVSQYSRCSWIAGTLLLNFVTRNKQVEAWWIAQGKSFDPDSPKFLGKTIPSHRIGRKALNIPFMTICESLKTHNSVAAAADKLGCSQGYIFNILRVNGLKLKDVFDGRVKA